MDSSDPFSCSVKEKCIKDEVEQESLWNLKTEDKCDDTIPLEPVTCFVNEHIQEKNEQDEVGTSGDIDPLDPLASSIKTDDTNEETDICYVQPEFCSVKTECFDEDESKQDGEAECAPAFESWSVKEEHIEDVHVESEEMVQKERKYGKWTQEDMSRAISALENNDMGINAVCRKYGVPKATLKRHMQGTNIFATNDTKKLGRSQDLPRELEDELFHRVLKLERMFFGLGREDLKRLAFQIAEENNIPHRFNKIKKMAGNKWYYSFLKRYPQLNLKKPKITSFAQTTGLCKDQVNEFFEKLVQVVDEHKFQASDIYNVDEMALFTVQNPRKIGDIKGKNQIIALTSREERSALTTGIFAMSASGVFLPPMLVFKGHCFKPEWKYGAPPETEFAVTDNGWSNSVVFYMWIQHFIKFVKPSIERKILLLLDGHASHTKDLNTINYAKQNGVVMLSLPNLTSHKLQPLNYSFFAPLKSNFNKAADRYMQTHQSNITVAQVSYILGESFPITAVAAIAVSGFKSCGIWPINKDKFKDED